MTISNVLDMISSDVHVEICNQEHGTLYVRDIIDYDTPIAAYCSIRDKYKNTTCKWIRADIANELTLIFDEFNK